MLRKGNGTISGAGGSGWGGGGGGRISLECYSVQDVKITVHGLYLMHIIIRLAIIMLVGMFIVLGTGFRSESMFRYFYMCFHVTAYTLQYS